MKKNTLYRGLLNHDEYYLFSQYFIDNTGKELEDTTSDDEEEISSQLLAFSVYMVADAIYEEDYSKLKYWNYILKFRDKSTAIGLIKQTYDKFFKDC